MLRHIPRKRIVFGGMQKLTNPVTLDDDGPKTRAASDLSQMTGSEAPSAGRRRHPGFDIPARGRLLFL
jgi:hypothetical protein